MMLAMLALFAVSFVLPFYFEVLRGFSVARAGFLLTPLPLTIALVAPFSGALADRVGSRWLAAGGLALASVGLLLLTRLDAHSPIEQIVGCLVLTGLGQGMFQSPDTRALRVDARRGARRRRLAHARRRAAAHLSRRIQGRPAGMCRARGGRNSGRARPRPGPRYRTVTS